MVIRPAMTSWLPSHSTSSAPMPISSPMIGKNAPWTRISSRLRRTVLLVGVAEALDLERLLPVGADDADAGQRFLRHRADRRQLLLDLIEAPVNHARRSSRPRLTGSAAGSARAASAAG